MDQTPMSNRAMGNRRASTAGSAAGSAGDNWNFDNTDNTNGNNFHTKQQSGDVSLASSKTPPGGSTGSRGSRGKQNNFDPFNQTQSVGNSTTTTASETTMASRKSRDAFADDNESGMDSHFPSDGGFGDPNDMQLQQVGKFGQDSSRSLGQDSNSESGPRVQVNIALNEDLTCFYKLSKMSSCSVEGVVQVRILTIYCRRST
jgi:hypothetical protein